MATEEIMREAQNAVREFHRKHDYLCPDRPAMLSPEDGQHRHDLIAEENTEYLEAVQEANLIKVADALADLAYVVLGAAVAHGIDLQPIFDEVHRSNMTKDVLDPVTRKGGKGPDYIPPDIRPLLFMQIVANTTRREWECGCVTVGDRWDNRNCTGTTHGGGSSKSCTQSPLDHSAYRRSQSRGEEMGYDRREDIAS